MASYTSGEASTFGGAGMGRAVGGGMTGPLMVDHSMRGRPGDMSCDVLTNGRNMNLANQLPVDSMPRPGRETVPLPLDASSTLYVEGLPPDSTRREVAHISRPFVGYKAVRLVSKESKHHGGDPLILCLVDFENPACAATALSASQGYEMDEHAPDSNYLRLQFSRFPGPRSRPGRKKRTSMARVTCHQCPVPRTLQSFYGSCSPYSEAGSILVMEIHMKKNETRIKGVKSSTFDHQIRWLKIFKCNAE